MKMSAHHTPRTCGGFTLLELLVVITIIAILSGLLFPAIAKVRTEMARGRAAAQAVAIANAVQSFRATYGTWPGQTQGVQDNVVTAPIILSQLTTNNTRGMVFLEMKDATVRGDWLVDSWGRAFNIAMDENGDGIVNVGIGGAAPWVCYAIDESGRESMLPVSDPPALAVSSRGVLVFSWGPDPAKVDKRVMSWER